MSDSGSHKKVANSLVALSSAAVLAVYTAGYLRTKSAADRFAVQAAVRRPPVTPAAAPSRLTLRGRRTTTSAPPPPSPLANRTTRRSARREADSTSPQQIRKSDGSNRHPLRPPLEATASAHHCISIGVRFGIAGSARGTCDGCAAAPAPPAPAKPIYKDGTYYGWGTSRHGDIQAAVVIQDGRIASATIAQCLTRYSCSVIAKLPPQVAERQSPETDYVSGATQSTNAFYYAVVEALSKAK